MSLPFDPAGYGQRITDEEIAKGLFSTTAREGRRAARNARRATRAVHREERIAARGGHLIQRKITSPIKSDLNRAMGDVNSQVDTAATRIQQAGEDASGLITTSAENAANIVGRGGKRAGMYIAGGTAAGLGGGIGGGMTLGALGRRVVDPNRQRREEKRRKRDYAVAKADLSDGYYPYLLPTIRQDIAGIPESRRNPISPLQQLSAGMLIGEGLADVRSLNPFFRRSRTIRGTQRMVLGQQMLNRGAGEPL